MPEVVTVRGVAEVRAALRRLVIEAPRQVAFTNKKAAAVVAQEAVRRAPHGPHEGGGTVVPVAQSIVATSTPQMGQVQAGGSKTPHAAGAEFGGFIPRRGLKGLNRRGKRNLRMSKGRGLTRLRRQSYLIPALKAKADDVLRIYGVMVDDLIARFGRN